MLVCAVNHGHTADLRGLQRLLGESDRVVVILDDVDFLSAQLADNRLHAHTFHADAGADRVHILVLRHDRNLGALTGLARNGADHDGSVVNLRHFGLEQMLDQLRRRA